MAFEGIDSRDLYRPGSGMTLRRLWVLIQALPWDSPLKVQVRDAQEKAKQATPDRLRSRQAEWEAQNAQRAKEAS